MVCATNTVLSKCRLSPPSKIPNLAPGADRAGGFLAQHTPGKQTYQAPIADTVLDFPRIRGTYLQMDSLTQFALGAAVSAACLGPSIGPRKAVLLGGVLGTLPDFDIFIPYDDPIDTFVLHRGATHALFVHALVTPLFGEALMRLVKGLRSERTMTYLAVFLCFATHAIIDAMTVYGTRLFWPIWSDPVGVGSIFIIDPLYSLPLLAAVIWALCLSSWTARIRSVTTIALLVSTTYMAGTMVLQSIAENRARTQFAEAGIQVDRVFAIAGPFNTVLWKVIGLEQDRYHNLYLSFLDGDTPPEIYTHPRGADLLACAANTPALQKLTWFTHGFLRAEERDQRIVVADLRMGLTPNYVFQFAVANRGDKTDPAMIPERVTTGRATANGDFAWLLARLSGEPASRTIETKRIADATSTERIGAC